MVVFFLRPLGLLPWQPAPLTHLHVAGAVKGTGQTLLPVHPLRLPGLGGGWGVLGCPLLACMLNLRFASQIFFLLLLGRLEGQHGGRAGKENGAKTRPQNTQGGSRLEALAGGQTLTRIPKE